MLGKTKRNLSPTEKRFFYLCAFTIALLLTSILPQSTVARTWYIKADGTGDAPTIQAGVDSSAVGDTVFVGAGVHSDTLVVHVAGLDMVANAVIEKSISVIGEGGMGNAIVDAASCDVSMLIRGEGTTVLIEGLTLEGDFAFPGCVLDAPEEEPPQAESQFGVWSRGASVTLERNVFRSLAHYAAYFDGGFSTVIDNQFDGAFDGIICTNGSDVSVLNNGFYRCVYPITGVSSKMSVLNNLIDGGGRQDTCNGINSAGCRALVRDNRILNPRLEGVSCGGGDDTKIEDNFIEGPNEGITVGNSDSVMVAGNIIYNCRWGIDVILASYVTIENNTLDFAYEIGIMCQVGASPIVRNNIIVRGDVGFFCDVGSNPVTECNDVFQVNERYYGCEDQTGLNGNISIDPEFCGIDDSGNYFLQSDSPCAPGNHPGGDQCGIIGGLGVNCGTVSIQDRSWGSLKTLYRKEEQ